MNKEKLITITLEYGKSTKEVIFKLECDEPLEASEVYQALSQYLLEYEREMFELASEDGGTIH